MTIPFHPLAGLFNIPLLDGADLDALATSISESGLLEPITLFEDMILDGRNRYRACERVGVEPQYEPFTGADPRQFVIDMNVHRRHLNESQRAMIAAEIATRPRGDQRNLGETRSLTQAEAGKMLGVNPATITDALWIMKEGTPEEIEAVKRGNARVTPIAKAIRDKTVPEKRKVHLTGGMADKGKNPQRIEKQRATANIWNDLRTGLNAICSLPIPTDVVRIAQQYDKRAGHIIDTRIPSAINWLKEFSDAWSNRHETTDKRPATDDHAHAGNRHRLTREKHA